jgi:DNA-binding MarR family transcriptional regulator
MVNLEQVSKPIQRTPNLPSAGEDIHDDVLIALRQIIHATDLHSKRVSRESGLTIPQIVVLKSVRDLGEVTTSAISRQVSLSQATVTLILDRLEERGLVERYRSTRDRRIVHSRLTRPGRSALRKAPGLLHERFRKKFSELSDRRQKDIVTALQKVAEMMGASDLDAAPLLEVGSLRKGTSARP